MPTLSVNADAESANEDQTLLTLYALAGEESGGFITFRPHFIHELGKAFFSAGSIPSPAPLTGEVGVRELTAPELVRAEGELWIHYHQQRRTGNATGSLRFLPGQKSSVLPGAPVMPTDLKWTASMSLRSSGSGDMPARS